MGYQSKTYSLSDDVIERLEGLRAEHGSVNRALLYILDMNVLPENRKVKKPTKKEAHVEALKASDPIAQIMERGDIEHGNMELPSSGSVATLDAVGPMASGQRGKATVQEWRRGPREKGDKTR